MSSDFDWFNISDLIQNDNRDCQFEVHLGDNLNNFDPNANNHWVWYPKSQSDSTSLVIYHHLNRNIVPVEHWIGWKKNYGELMLPSM